MCKSIEIPHWRVFSFTLFRRSRIASPALGSWENIELQRKEPPADVLETFCPKAMCSKCCDKIRSADGQHLREAIGTWGFQQNVFWGTTTEEVYEVIYIEPRSALQIKRGYQLRIKMMMHPRFCCSYSTIGTGDCTLLCASKWNTLFIETRTTTVRSGERVYVTL